MTNWMGWLSVRTVVVVLIIAVHVLLVIAFVPVVRVERPAFVVTEVSLAAEPERTATVEVAERARPVDSAPAAGVR